MKALNKGFLAIGAKARLSQNPDVGTENTMNNGHARITVLLAVLLGVMVLIAVRLYSTLMTTSLRMAEIYIVDISNKTAITNFQLKTPPVTAELHQLLLLRPAEGRFVLAHIGNDPLRVTVVADGYRPAKVDLGDTAFSSDPIVVRMERTANATYRKEALPIKHSPSSKEEHNR